MSATEPADLGAERERFRAAKQALVDDFLGVRATAPAALHLVHALTALVDATLRRLWRAHGLPAQAALLAVGGYGRGELMPHSDVDLLILLPEAGPEAAAEAVAAEALAAEGEAARGPATQAHEALRQRVGDFVTACWDMGLEPGVAVRTPSECAQQAGSDVTVQTALLEHRRLIGSAALTEAFEQATQAVMEPAAFLRAKTLEMRQRHVKYEDTPYALEPNCKESPGGLRDLQVVIWVARAAGLGQDWAQLAAHGLATPFEWRQLQRHHGTLTLIRARLHAIAGRREDRLVFDLQTAVAESFGYAPTARERASEQLMRRYYWAAKAVTQLNQILMLNLAERIEVRGRLPMRPINAMFFDRGGMLEVASDGLYLEQPHAILETFLVFAQTPGIKGLSARTLRALYNARHVMDADFRHDPVNRALFMTILRQPQGITHAFRLMNQTSVLGRYLWVFRRIVGRMQHDLFHAYTVDQHILMVLRNVRRFFIPEHGHEYPFCSQLAAGWDKPELLYMAALFHDVAKGRGGDHSELGALEVRRFARDHGLGADDASLVEFLVRHHLTMSHVAQKEDLSEPAVIARFTDIVATPRRLTALYLLTVADIRGTSPKVWNAWKAKLLEDLFRIALRALGGGRPDAEAELEARKLEARQALALATARPGTEAPLWATLEPSYFARHDSHEIAWHARALWRHLEAKSPVVSARPSPIGAGMQVVVYAPDEADLFARICGHFDQAGFSILDAKVHTTRAGYALDTFQLTHPQGEAQASAYRDLVPLLEHQLAATLAARGPLPEPTRARLSRRVRSFPVQPHVSLTPDERAQRWLLNVSASDRSGLLYGVARVLARHGINLQLAKITTLGERVEDTFLIDGPALQQSRLQLQIEDELLDAISAAPSPPSRGA